MKAAAGEINVIPTGVIAPIKKIVDFNKDTVVLVFGRADPEDAPIASAQPADLNIEDQKRKIGAALELPVEISYLGHRPGDDINPDAPHR